MNYAGKIFIMKNFANKNKKVLLLLIIVSFSNFIFGNDIRRVFDFNKNWLYDQNDWVGFYHGSSMSWDESDWISVSTPHTFNAQDTFDNDRGYYRGFAWYRKHFDVPESEKGRILKVHFGAIGNESEIWVNQKFMGKFTNGYTPIEIDITDFISWDSDNVIAIRVNNLHNDEIPPGRWRMDYNVYGGIYREVELLSLSPIYLEKNGLFVQSPEVAESVSRISVSASIHNTSFETQKAKIQCDLYNGEKLVANFSSSLTLAPRQKIPVRNLIAEVRDVDLWSVDNPHLYKLKVSLHQDDKILDIIQTKMGFRSFRFDPDKGFFLNGQSLKLHGLNRHQCYPGMGNAVPKRFQVEDAILLKELGANFVRCAHYPQHPIFLDACDSLGLIVYEEVASWQHIGGEEFIDNMNTMMEGMIKRDRNHPSIVLWGMMNEGQSYEMFERLHKTAKDLDPTRPSCYSENRIEEGIKEGTIYQPDVLGLNYNLNKYDDFHANYPGIALVNTECTNADQTKIGELKGELEAVAKIKSDLDFIAARDYLAGACIWGFHDYGTNYEPVWPMQTSGVVNEYRQLKETAYYLKARWQKDPFIHIAGHWNFTGDEGKVKEVHVWHNCEKAEIYLNGKRIKNVANNAWEVPYESGELKAIGKIGTKTVEYVLRTAGVAQKLVCSIKDGRIKASEFDAILVNASFVDNEGNIVPENDEKVSFQISGPGKIVGIGGSVSSLTEKGTASIVIQSTGEEGIIEVKAISTDLISSPIEIEARK